MSVFLKILTYIFGVLLSLAVIVGSTYYLAVNLGFNLIISEILSYFFGIFVISTFEAFFNYQAKEELDFVNFLKFIFIHLFGAIFYLILIIVFEKFLNFNYFQSIILSAFLTFILNFLIILLVIEKNKN